MPSQAYLKSLPIKPAATVTRPEWHNSRFACVLLASECPPSKYEAWLIAESMKTKQKNDAFKKRPTKTGRIGVRTPKEREVPETVARLILKEDRTFLPEFAAVVEMARLRCFDRQKYQRGNRGPAYVQYCRTRNMMAKKLETRPDSVALLSWGMMPAGNLKDVCRIIFRICGWAGLTMAEAVEMYSRATLPREYLPWRARPKRNRLPLNPPDGTAVYREMAAHFMNEVMGTEAYSWMWKQMLEHTRQNLEQIGLRYEEAFVELKTIHPRFGTYYADENLAPKVEERFYLMPEIDRDNPAEFHGEDGD